MAPPPLPPPPHVFNTAQSAAAGLLQIMEFCNWYKATNKPDMSDKELMLLRAQTMVSMSTRILG